MGFESPFDLLGLFRGIGLAQDGASPTDPELAGKPGWANTTGKTTSAGPGQPAKGGVAGRGSLIRRCPEDRPNPRP